MEHFFQSLTPIALGVVVVILGLGLFNMMRGGSASTSQRLMRLRVLAQFIAVIIIMTSLYFASH
jgi:Hypoxia induced protein conserved region